MDHNQPPCEDETYSDIARVSQYRRQPKKGFLSVLKRKLFRKKKLKELDTCSNLKDASTQTYTVLTSTLPREDMPGAPSESSANPLPSTSPPNHTHSSSNRFQVLRQLQTCNWYWGPLSFGESCEVLKDRPDGMFLLRDSADEYSILTLSFKLNGAIYHSRVDRDFQDSACFRALNSSTSGSLLDFLIAIELPHSQSYSFYIRPREWGESAIPVELRGPVYRNESVQSLQHMARFVILQRVRMDHIDRLPLPDRLKAYLSNKQYYVE